MTDDQHEGDELLKDPRRQFAEELKSARELHKPRALSQRGLATELQVGKSTIARMEGDGNIPPYLPARLDELFGTDGKFKRLWEEIIKGGYVDYSLKRIELEAQATAIAEWSSSIVPGLLQTLEYARALLRAGDPRTSEAEVSKLAAMRVARQDVLRLGTPPDFSVVLCESVILRRVGSAEVMRGQLETLLAYAKQPTTIMQVLPLGSDAHGLMDGPLTTLTTPDGDTVAYTEGLVSGMIIDDPAAVRRLCRAYDGVTASALSTAHSVELIRKQLEAL
ncbi:helix-turn-helix domain-containing protein [Streptomyces noursei]|uniref:helix-turn-helix domain-containing protein n=1 Tax=Streptomyces noursei TaxID=1971 RepID=UPI002155EDFA|nr:helix-turn-helix transcriptional regulator [Streptomyces noursei]